MDSNPKKMFGLHNTVSKAVLFLVFMNTVLSDAHALKLGMHLISGRIVRLF
jgi:hypothetical protein